jgi:hypothetical protein
MIQLDPNDDVGKRVDEILEATGGMPVTAPKATKAADQAKATAEAKAKRDADKEAAAKVQADAKATKDAERESIIKMIEGLLGVISA